MIAPLPFAWECKPGSATLPFFGVQPVLLTDKGVEIQGPGELVLFLKVWGGRFFLRFGVGGGIDVRAFQVAGDNGKQRHARALLSRGS